MGCKRLREREARGSVAGSLRFEVQGSREEGRKASLSPRTSFLEPQFSDATIPRDAVLPPHHRPRGSRAPSHAHEDLLRLSDGVRGGAEYARLSGVSRVSGGAAGAEPRGGESGDPDGAGDGQHGPQPERVCAEELLLPRLAEGIPDLAVRPAAGDGWEGRHRRADDPADAHSHGG